MSKKIMSEWYKGVKKRQKDTRAFDRKQASDLAKTKKQIMKK